MSILKVTRVTLEQKVIKVIKVTPAKKGDTGNGIASVTLKSGDHLPGTTDIYTITFTDNTSVDFHVYNGADGELTVEDIVNDLATGQNCQCRNGQDAKRFKSRQAQSRINRTGTQHLQICLIQRQHKQRTHADRRGLRDSKFTKECR